jgi:hypothetical protein
VPHTRSSHKSLRAISETDYCVIEFIHRSILTFRSPYSCITYVRNVSKCYNYLYLLNEWEKEIEAVGSVNNIATMYLLSETYPNLLITYFFFPF